MLIDNYLKYQRFISKSFYLLVVNNNKDLHEDPQLIHRGHFRTMRHPVIGDYGFELPPIRSSVVDTQLNRSAPCLGEHSSYVCSELLGIPDDEFVQLLSDGVFE